MKTRKSGKLAMFSSVICLILCCSMLLGSTYAWFTDSVTNNENIIASGTLDVKMSYSDKIDGTYVDASEGKIFEYKLWEPGYTEVRYIKIENAGNLAFQFKLELVSDEVVNEDGVKLSEVIDVYMGTEAASRDDLTNLTCVGTLADLMADADGAAYGIMMPEESQTYCIALKMQESAGNEYQDLSIGGGIAIKLYAEQYTHEKDSFGPDYDANTHLPVAAVYRAPEYIGVTNLDWNDESPVKEPSVALDTAYVFKTTETYDEAQENPYAKWHADFVVSFDRDVTAADGVGIAGNYGSYKWIGFDLNEELLNAVGAVDGTLAANTPVRLLKTAGISMNYEELCLLVKEFYCGAWADSVKSDLTMTVELRLYEVEEPSESNGNSWNVETGNSEVIGTYKYTFKAEAPSIPSDLPVAVVSDADEYENVAIKWNDQYGIYPPEGTQLESVYTFTAQDDYNAAQASPYADWTADYYVTLDRDLADNQLVLGGNYGSYGWIGFVAPGGIAANTATPLLQSANMTFTYEDIVLTVQEFTCGVADIGNALSGATITVELRLTNPSDSTEYYVINSTQYTFQ